MDRLLEIKLEMDAISMQMGLYRVLSYQQLEPAEALACARKAALLMQKSTKLYLEAKQIMQELHLTIEN